MTEKDGRSHALKMIIAIVQRGKADAVVGAAIKAGGGGAAIRGGAPAATVVFGRGQGMRERLGPLGVAIQPEKEIILIILEEWLVDQVLKAMVKEGQLDKAGIGFVFEVPVEKAIGFVEAHELLRGEAAAKP
jgi:nitrogen regulatory protein P-II 1